MTGPRNLNIERVFVGMRRAWNPPSSAGEASFGRLTGVLGEIFATLKSDPELAPLHVEIYAELRPDGDEEAGALPLSLEAPDGTSYLTDRTKQEFSRKAFYLCNSMIQLMENVYMDLQMEREHRHPDNRGWTNLFRRWARAKTFRKAWAVSAPTYGLRFQDFCHRHLGLGLGRTDLVQVWHRRPRSGFPNPRARALLEDWEIEAVRVFRRDRTRGQANPFASSLRKVLAGRLVVPGSPTGGEALRLTYGVAILDDKGQIQTLWVREHLRSRGLGRQLIRDLILRMGVADTELLDTALLRRLGQPAHNVERLENLFRSVLNEVRLEASQRAIAHDPDGLAELEPLPVLAYTGFIRPTAASWAHALALVCWLIAWLPDTRVERLESQEMRRILKQWLRGNLLVRELRELLATARAWSRDRSSQELEAELSAVLGPMSQEAWYREQRYAARIGRDLHQIAWADTRRAPEEVRLISRISELLRLGEPE